MRTTRTAKVTVQVGPITVMSAKVTPRKNGTEVDTHVPADKRFREYCLAVVLMVAHQLCEEPWQHVKIGSLLGSLSVGNWEGEVEGRADLPQPPVQGPSGDYDIPF